jgi:HEAT repeat protein
MRGLLADPNDRLREVAYSYVEQHPDPALAPTLLAALEKEESEFVRPSLIRALAAIGKAPKVAETLAVEVNRGVDFFRSAVIEALGDHKAAYALPPLTKIAQLEGPLQDDAALALGKIGDKRALETLAALQRTAPRVSQPAVAAAICLLGVNCSSHQGFIEETLRFAVANRGFQELLRSAAAGLAAIAIAGNEQALGTLFDVGAPTTDPARAPIALAIGSVALRNTPLLLEALQSRDDIQPALALLGEAFDMLEEDYQEEQFYVTVRRGYWQAPEGSPARRIGQALIEKLEF